MNRRLVGLGAIGAVCAFALAPTLGATTDGKKPIQIDSYGVGTQGGTGTFYLSLGTGGDTGTLTFRRSDDSKFGHSPDKTPDKIPFTLDSRVTKTTRTYNRLRDIVSDVDLARVLVGFHFLSSDQQGSNLGRKVGHYVAHHFLQRLG